MATLIKRQVLVLTRTDIFPDGSACYEQGVDEFMPRPIRSVFLTKELIGELGDPDRITIRVEPGDTLKEGDG